MKVAPVTFLAWWTGGQLRY